ncbi:DUF6607 family protein [Abyssalbus ytuae]|uniref:Uncharacterized protein n=1 Tax=Abyssalbus ytuae TaxID=2926907 RepID=A0A9E6ZLM8_9FLAO|nr:DUF6607 family protein [Abyssalbus ytuae]UOB16440.1 hypothetical protein MQE35_11910 [Abyssalbus ytuae]
MKRQFFILLFLSLASISVTAQSKKKLDRQAIKSMCGCYEVTFKYTETFAPEVDYEMAHDYTSGALEWVQLVEDEKNKISLQHLLVINDEMIIKHWRQDWLYENTHFYRFDGGNSWKFETKTKDDVKGQWTQNVYQVDDSPRYTGSGTWIHADGKTYWENKADSPLPRREYTKRNDYNVMKRGNRYEITNYGWLHEQDNDKIIREKGKEDVLLVQEKGYNIYKKVEDSECQKAQDWWVANKETWKSVRNKWDEVLAKNSDLKLKTKVENKRLYEYLFYTEEEINPNYISTLVDKFIE